MFKKMIFILLFIVVCSVILFASSVDYQEEYPKLRQMAIEFIKKGDFKNYLDSEYFKIEVEPDDEMEIPYKDYKEYLIRFRGDIDEWEYHRVFIKDDKIFNAYTDFNKILMNEGIKIDSTNAFEIVSDYLHLIKGKKLQIKNFSWKNSEYKLNQEFIERSGIKEKYIFSLEVYAYNKINGLELKYLIGFKNGYIRIMQTEILDIYKGDYIKDDTIPTPKIKKYFPKMFDTSLMRRNID